MSQRHRQRPAAVSKRTYDQNYTRTFSTAMHQNQRHPDSATGTTGTQAVELRISQTRNTSHG